MSDAKSVLEMMKENEVAFAAAGFRPLSIRIPEGVTPLEARTTLYLQPEGKGLRTYEAGKQRSFRDFGIGAQILRDLGVRKLRLVTNNPRNLIGLSGYGLEITSSVSFTTPPNTIGRPGAAG